jgi:microcystin degradation protein MlrC
MVTGDDKEKVTAGAEDLANSFWHVRLGFDFIAPTAPFSECIEKAVKSEKIPFIISDMGDNPTAGGAGDVTWTLNEILKRDEFKSGKGPSLIYASIPGPDLVEKAVKLGIGKNVEAFVGAEVDDRYSPPLKLNGRIVSIKHGDKHAETEVVVKI